MRIAPLAGCKAVPESFDSRLECAVFAQDAQAVRDVVSRSLRRDRYGIDVLESVIAFDPDAWNDANDPGQAIRSAARDARSSRMPVFASFACGPQVEGGGPGARRA